MKRFLLWNYPRAGWQYDVIVGLILAFIFLTPRELFRDQPRASNVVRLPSEQGLNMFWIEPELLSSLPESERGSKVASLLKGRYRNNEPVVRIEPIVIEDRQEREVKGYIAFTKP